MTHRLLILLIASLAAAASHACRLPNEDHCVHKAIDSDAWCAKTFPDRPYCSPCAAEDHGCVMLQPTPSVCPAYSPDTQASSDEAASADGGSMSIGR